MMPWSVNVLMTVLLLMVMVIAGVWGLINLFTLYSRQLHFTMKAVALNGRLQEKRFEQVKEK